MRITIYKLRVNQVSYKFLLGTLYVADRCESWKPNVMELDEITEHRMVLKDAENHKAQARDGIACKSYKLSRGRKPKLFTN